MSAYLDRPRRTLAEVQKGDAMATPAATRAATPTQSARCRICGQTLRGNAYHLGGDAWHPRTGERCLVNKYGGFVCSDLCDRRATYDLEASMPHNIMGGPRP